MPAQQHQTQQHAAREVSPDRESPENASKPRAINDAKPPDTLTARATLLCGCDEENRSIRRLVHFGRLRQARCHVSPARKPRPPVAVMGQATRRLYRKEQRIGPDVRILANPLAGPWRYALVQEMLYHPGGRAGGPRWNRNQVTKHAPRGELNRDEEDFRRLCNNRRGYRAACGRVSGAGCTRKNGSAGRADHSEEQAAGIAEFDTEDNPCGGAGGDHRGPDGTTGSPAWRYRRVSFCRICSNLDCQSRGQR